MYIQIWSTEKIKFSSFRSGITFFFSDYVLDTWAKTCNWTHSLKQVRFNLGEIFPQPELQWKDTQYRQKNTNRTSNSLHTYKCQSHDTN